MTRLTVFGLLSITATAQAYAQGGTDIFVATLQQSGRSVTITAPVNVTKRAGYDNQPSFTPDGKSLLYTSIGADGQANTWSLRLPGGAPTQLTNTPIGVYSPTVTPDGRFFSTIRVELDSTQRLWKFPVNGGEPTLVLDSIKPVGYHAWLNDGTLALFVLGNPATLQIADVATGRATTVASNIGRALVKVPHHDAVNFVQVVPDSGQFVAEYDLVTKSVRRLGKLPDSSDYVVWTPRGALLTAAGSRIYRWNDGVWTEVADFAGLGIRGISRLAISPAGDRIAFVAEDP